MLARAHGVELLGEMAGSGYAQAPLLARRADGQTIQLTPLLYRVLEALDGERTNLEVAWAVASATGKVLSANEVKYLVDDKLRPLGLVTDEHGNEPEHAPRTNPLLGLKLRFVVSNPKWTNRLTAPFALLFHPVVAIPVIAAFVAVTGWVFFDKGIGSALHEAIYDPRFLLLTFALTIVSAGFHEFGHAAAAKYGGATPGAMGAALYLVWPAFYTDVTDSYRLDRRGRLRVDVGGLYFNAIFAVATFLAYVATGRDSLLVMVPVQVLQMVRQLLPLVRFDGYHILADLTGVPDLFARIVPTLKGLLPSHWHDPDTKVLKPWARAVVTIWTLAVIPVLAAGFALLVLGLPRLLATAHQSLQLQFAVLDRNLGDGELVNAAVRALSIVAIALPPLSATYLLARVTRRTSTRVWRAAAQYPAAQGALAIGFGSVVAFAAMALWPGDHYMPVQADERAAVGDRFAIVPSKLIRAAHSELLEAAFPALARVTSADEAVADPATGDGPDRLAWREVRLDDGADRLLAGTTDAATASAAGTSAAGTSAGVDRGPWPFPFAPPPEPGPQDNFAVAVNTVDRRHVADVSADFRWLGEARVEHRNRSYAIAECVDCTTIAAAFQVVVASDASRIVVPENSAVSINHECTSCITHSVAVQLVVTTFETPPDSVRRAVRSRYAAVEALEARAHSIASGELRSLFLDAKADILQLLAPYAVKATTHTDSDGAEVTTLADTTGDDPTAPTSNPQDGTTLDGTTAQQDAATSSMSAPQDESTTQAGMTSPTSTTSQDGTTQDGTTQAGTTQDPTTQDPTTQDPTTSPTPTSTSPSTSTSTSTTTSTTTAPATTTTEPTAQTSAPPATSGAD